MTTDQIVETINNDETEGRNIWGLRCLPQDCDASVGDILPPSYRWEDGNNTGEEMDGTSAIRAALMDCAAEVDEVDIVLRRVAIYRGSRIALLAAPHAMGGEDQGEIVMHEPVVVAIWTRP